MKGEIREKEVERRAKKRGGEVEKNKRKDGKKRGKIQERKTGRKRSTGKK